MSNLRDIPNVPMTLEEAAEPLFGWTYAQLRNQMRVLLAQDMPAVKEGRGYLLYPRHILAWRRYRGDAPPAEGAAAYEQPFAFSLGVL